MTVKLGVIMDPIEGINVNKDSTFAMLLEAQRRAYKIYYLQQSDLFHTDNKILGQTSLISVQDDPANWYELHDSAIKDLSELDVVLMRKDPPVNMEYVYTTYLLDRLHEMNTLVINHPSSLRNANEKLLTTCFPDCTPPYTVSRNKQMLDDFIDAYKEVVIKPLDGMAGDSIFRINHTDPNRNVIVESITQNGQRTVMAQQFIAEYKKGDKRILIIDGEPIEYALLRIPAKGELRANLAKGGTGKGIELSANDYSICEQIKPTLVSMQLTFVGIDIIGNYLTEINVTSPTGIRELDKIYKLNISAKLFDSIENRLIKNQ